MLSGCDKKILYVQIVQEKKGKYIDYEDLLPECINDGNYFYLINKYFNNLLF